MGNVQNVASPVLVLVLALVPALVLALVLVLALALELALWRRRDRMRHQKDRPMLLLFSSTWLLISTISISRCASTSSLFK